MTAWADVILTDERMKRIKLLYVQKCMQNVDQLKEILTTHGISYKTLQISSDKFLCSASPLLRKLSDHDAIEVTETDIQALGIHVFAEATRQSLREAYEKQDIAGLVGRLEDGRALDAEELKTLFFFASIKAKSDAIVQGLDEIPN